jgi:hypothetical protein
MKILEKIRDNISSLEEFSLLIRIFFLVAVLPIMLKRLSVSKLMQVFTPRNTISYKKKDMKKYKENIVKFTDYVLNLTPGMWKGTCLKRSLVLYFLLRKLGMDVRICFGTRYNRNLSNSEAKKNLEGHAWLIYKGSIFLERNTELTKTYTMTYSFPEGHN